MDAATEASPSQTCATCGSTRLSWRVKRLRAPGGYASLRTLAWQCQECGEAWDEPLSRGPDGSAAEWDEVTGV